MKILTFKIIYKNTKITITEPLLQVIKIINQTILFIFLHERDG